jgi:hypothetical protein
MSVLRWFWTLYQPKRHLRQKVPFLNRWKPMDKSFVPQTPIIAAVAQAVARSCSEHNDGKLRLVYRLAEGHCMNFLRGGTCEGADTDPRTGRHLRWRQAGGRCLLGLDCRCPYFEQAILPMESRKEWPTPLQGEAFRKAARLYHSVFPETVVTTPEVRKCPDCGKRSVEPRKRYCAECRTRRRKATDSENHRNHRKQVIERHTVKQIRSSLVADPQA